MVPHRILHGPGCIKADASSVCVGGLCGLGHTRSKLICSLHKPGVAADACGRRVGGLGGMGATAAAAGRRQGRPDALLAQCALGNRVGRGGRQIWRQTRRCCQARHPGSW